MSRVDGPEVVLRPGRERPTTSADGIVSRHGLSFGAHYDPARTSFGALVAHNDDTLAPGVAYGVHDHRDVEILTWVRSGAMRHRGPTGEEHIVVPGTLQVLAAGTGWRHDEACAGPEPVRLLQMWIAPGHDDPPPGPSVLRHTVVDLRPGRPVVVAGGAGASLALQRQGVTLTVMRLAAGDSVAVSSAAWRHVHVTRGSVAADGVAAGAGDTLEVTGAGRLVLDARARGAEVLVLATASPPSAPVARKG